MYNIVYYTNDYQAGLTILRCAANITVVNQMAERQNPEREARLFTVKEAARYLGTTSATIYTKIWRREIPFIKLGRSVRLDIHDLDEMIDRGRVGSHEIGPHRDISKDTCRGNF